MFDSSGGRLKLVCSGQGRYVLGLGGETVYRDIIWELGVNRFWAG